MLAVTTDDGAEIAVHDLGGDGPVLLMVHGAGLHGRVWEPVARRLDDRFHCLAVDVRAHGRSRVPEPGPGPTSGPAPDLAWPRLAADILAVVDGGGLHRPFGLGHSMGATLLLLAEESRPGTFAGLYCIEPIGARTDDPPPPDPGHPLATRARDRRDSFPSRQEALQAYGAKLPFSEVAPEALEAYVEHGLVEADDGSLRLRCRPEHEAAVFAAGMSHPVFRHLGAVGCPVTLAVGARSQVLSPAVVERWADRLPRARVEVLAGLGHFAPFEAPAVVAAAVAAALGLVPGP